MTDFLMMANKEVADYLDSFAVAQDHQATLRKMEEFALQADFPIVGPAVGCLLHILAQSIQAKRVFEFGSGYGYSAYWFAKAVGKTGQVICTESSEENASLAADYLSQLGVAKMIDYHLGMAQDVFAETAGDFDIIYNDVDKEQYPGVFSACWQRIRSGGFYIADNALWSGRVVAKNIDEDKLSSTNSILEHNKMIFSHPEFDTSILPIRDGVLVARKK